ncbi:hypothetical protein EX30DRAFT_125609 [Ascodesmis nigricans]|uniref:Uncharacterized protein n=1 Tax=Ascodesmis nigricans TaxID=341454 RepID=A0A4S2MP40_9PEZI|nr:hypothetical protein EX30DRAFT_125609 [Ascodesmis nigricans]
MWCTVEMLKLGWKRWRWGMCTSVVWRERSLLGWMNCHALLQRRALLLPQCFLLAPANHSLLSPTPASPPPLHPPHYPLPHALDRHPHGPLPCPFPSPPTSTVRSLHGSSSRDSLCATATLLKSVMVCCYYFSPAWELNRRNHLLVSRPPSRPAIKLPPFTPFPRGSYCSLSELELRQRIQTIAVSSRLPLCPPLPPHCRSCRNHREPN